MPYLSRPDPDPKPMDCRILTAALKLFVNHGYHNVSVHDVQKLADVSIGSIYKHFGGKEGIAKALHERLLVEMNEMVDSVIAQDLTIIEKCNHIIELLFEYTETRCEIIAFILHANHTEFISSKPPICSAEPFQKIRDMVQLGMDSGEIQSYDCLVAASVIFGGAFRLIHMRLDGLIDRPLPELYDQLIDATWKGMKIEDDSVPQKLASNE
ncbi:MAG: TetR/AcrR family transcriptional regulator [Gammaproteobacteria bacterium]|nr:TetR/AcrR family transcriptional regulator [Gammaproteobacteria bacterium]